MLIGCLLFMASLSVHGPEITQGNDNPWPPAVGGRVRSDADQQAADESSAATHDPSHADPTESQPSATQSNDEPSQVENGHSAATQRCRFRPRRYPEAFGLAVVAALAFFYLRGRR